MSTSPEPSAAGRSRAAALLALTLLVAAPYLGQALSKTTTLVDDPDKMDITMQWLPGYSALGDFYRRGEFPLWNPDEFLGLPWTGYAHTGSLYPPAAFLFAALDYFDAADVSVLWHALFGAWGAYWLLGSLGRRAWPSLAGALVYAQTGATFHLANHFSSLHLTAWLPWVAFALARLMRRPTLARFVGLAASLTMMVLGGDAEGSVYAMMLCGLAALFVFGGTERKSRPGLVAAALALGLAFLAVAAMSIGVLELSANSIRDPGAGVVVGGQAQIGGWHLLLPQLLAPFSYYAELRPHSTFNHGLTPFYFGLSVLALAVFAAVEAGKDREARGWLLTIALLLAYLAAMDAAWLAPLTTRLPVLGKLASRGRMLIEIQLALAALAALGLERLGSAPRRRVAVLCLLAGAFVLATAPWSVSAASRAPLIAGLLIGGGLLLRAPALLPRMAVALVILDLTPLALWAAPRNHLEQFQLDPADAEHLRGLDPSYRFLPFEKLLGQGRQAPEIAGGVETETDLRTPIGFMRLPPARSFQYLHLANPSLLTDSRGLFSEGPATTLAMNISALDNPDFISPAYLRLMSLAGCRYWIARGVSLKFSRTFPLLTENGLVEGDWMDWSRSRNLEASIATSAGERVLRTGLPYRLDTAFYVYPETSLTLGARGDGAEVTVELRTRDGSWSRQRTVSPGRAPARLDFDLSSLAGDKRELSLILTGEGEAEIVDPALHRPDMPLELARPGEVDLYLNPAAMPRAFVVHSFQVLARGGPLEEALVSGKVDLARTVLLERADEEARAIDRLGAAAGPEREPVKIKAGSQRVEIDAILARPGFLVFTDTYYPGWRAKDNGGEKRILPADLAFRAVMLDSGRHRLVMTFEPASFRVGLWASITAVLAMLAALVKRSINRKGERR